MANTFEFSGFTVKISNYKIIYGFLLNHLPDKVLAFRKQLLVNGYTDIEAKYETIVPQDYYEKSFTFCGHVVHEFNYQDVRSEIQSLFDYQVSDFDRLVVTQLGIYDDLRSDCMEWLIKNNFSNDFSEVEKVKNHVLSLLEWQSIGAVLDEIDDDDIAALELIPLDDSDCIEDGLTDEQLFLWCDQSLHGGLDD